MNNQVKWELHAHTSPASRCGRLSPESLARGVRECGCFGMVVTDHYDPERFLGAQKGPRFRAQIRDLYAGYRAAAEAGKALGLIVLAAAELRIEAGHEDYLLYGLTEELALEAGCLTGLSLKHVKQRLAALGVLIVQAHPFRAEQNAAKPRLLDGVEVWNGNPRHDSHNDQALAFAQSHNLIMTRGSDVHQLTDFGTACMLLPKVRDERALVAALWETLDVS